MICFWSKDQFEPLHRRSVFVTKLCKEGAEATYIMQVEGLYSLLFDFKERLQDRVYPEDLSSLENQGCLVVHLKKSVSLA